MSSVVDLGALQAVQVTDAVGVPPLLPHPLGTTPTLRVTMGCHAVMMLPELKGLLHRHPDLF